MNIVLNIVKDIRKNFIISLVLLVLSMKMERKDERVYLLETNSFLFVNSIHGCYLAVSRHYVKKRDKNSKCKPQRLQSCPFRNSFYNCPMPTISNYLHGQFRTI